MIDFRMKWLKVVNFDFAGDILGGVADFFDPTGFTSGIIGGGGDAGVQAAQLEAEGNRKAIAEIRRQFDVTQGNLAPFLEAGTGALPGVIQGSTPQGLEEILAEIFRGGGFKSLLDERTRSVEGSLAAGGLTRSGAGIRELANIPTELGFQIENLLFGRQAGLAGAGQNAAAQLGVFGGQASTGIAGLQQDIGRAQGGGIITDQQARAAQQQQLLTAAATAAAFFSDPSLKENVEQIGKIKSLNLYQWDWIPEAEDTIVVLYPTIGFMTDEVEAIYPEYVSTYGGFKTINYLALLDRLEHIELEAA